MDLATVLARLQAFRDFIKGPAAASADRAADVIHEFEGVVRDVGTFLRTLGSPQLMKGTPQHANAVAKLKAVAAEIEAESHQVHADSSGALGDGKWLKLLAALLQTILPLLVAS